MPLTCCVLNNTDPENPEPERLEACQWEAQNSPSTFRFLHNEVFTIFLLFYHLIDKKPRDN